MKKKIENFVVLSERFAVSVLWTIYPTKPNPPNLTFKEHCSFQVKSCDKNTIATSIKLFMAPNNPSI
jgi:hypothetical protein